MAYYADQWTDRAVAAYYRRAARLYPAAEPMIPNRGLTRREGNVILIENVNGILAKYRITGSRLRYIES